MINCRNCSVGVDIESVSRFKKINKNKNHNFLNRIFTTKEIKYCFSDTNFARHLAGRFVAKEATLKALHALGFYNFSLKEIEIINNHLGVPEVNLSHKNNLGINISLSITHDKNKAIAFVLINFYGKNKSKNTNYKPKKHN